MLQIRRPGGPCEISSLEIDDGEWEMDRWTRIPVGRSDATGGARRSPEESTCVPSIKGNMEKSQDENRITRLELFLEVQRKEIGRKEQRDNRENYEVKKLEDMR